MFKKLNDLFLSFSKYKSIWFLTIFLMIVGDLLDSAKAETNLLIQTVKQVESRLDARVGLAIYDLESNNIWGYNAYERFPMTSTFKVLACGALLARNDASSGDSYRTVTLVESDFVSYSPVTENWLGQKVTLNDLCDATMRTSDNTAANKIVKELGGPSAVTIFMRSIGDGVTRLDRWEPDLNMATPGDERDTTTPAAMVSSLHKLLVGDALLQSSKEQLLRWLQANEVGDSLLRASVPSEWHIGDRTGAGGFGSRGIVAIAYPPEREPFIVAIYITETEASMEQRNEAIAEIGAALVEQWKSGK